MTETLNDILQLVGTAVVKFELCADKHLASLSGFQQKLYAKPVWGEKNKEIIEITCTRIMWAFYRCFTHF